MRTYFLSIVVTSFCLSAQAQIGVNDALTQSSNIEGTAKYDVDGAWVSTSIDKEPPGTDYFILTFWAVLNNPPSPHPERLRVGSVRVRRNRFGSTNNIFLVPSSFHSRFATASGVEVQVDGYDQQGSRVRHTGSGVINANRQ